MFNKKVLLVFLAILIGVGIGLYQNPRVRDYFERKTDQLLPQEMTTSTVYKWRDAQGKWQISDQPPQAGIPYETLQYDHKTNLLPKEAFTGKSQK